MQRSDEEVERLLDRMSAMLDDYEASKDSDSRGKWKESHQEQLGKYEDTMKRLNGDAFDIYNESYNEYHRDFPDMDEETYIDRLTVVLAEQIDRLKAALNTDELTIESTEDGTIVTTDVEDAEGTEEELNESADGSEPEQQMEAEEALAEDGSSISEDEMAELEEVSKNMPRHY